MRSLWGLPSSSVQIGVVEMVVRIWLVVTGRASLEKAGRKNLL